MATTTAGVIFVIHGSLTDLMIDKIKNGDASTYNIGKALLDGAADIIVDGSLGVLGGIKWGGQIIFKTASNLKIIKDGVTSLRDLVCSRSSTNLLCTGTFGNSGSMEGPTSSSRFTVLTYRNFDGETGQANGSNNSSLLRNASINITNFSKIGFFGKIVSLSFNEILDTRTSSVFEIIASKNRDENDIPFDDTGVVFGRDNGIGTTTTGPGGLTSGSTYTIVLVRANGNIATLSFTAN